MRRRIRGLLGTALIWGAVGVAIGAVLFLSNYKAWPIDPVHWNTDLQTAFMVYAVGFGLLSWIVCELNRHALRRADRLGLSEGERYETGTEIGLHWILTGTAVLSLLLSGLALAWPGDNAPGPIAALPVWVYAALGAVMPANAVRRNRVWAARQPTEAAA